MRTTMAHVLTAAFFVMTVGGCQKEEEGPAEKLGKQADQAVDDAGEAIEDFGKEMQKKSRE